MVTFLGFFHAAIAYLAVKWVFFPTASTYATFIAVVYFLFLKIIIKQITNCTKIRCKFNFTLCAWFLRALNVIAVEAFYLFDRMPINSMIEFRINFIMILFFIMAKSAGEKFIAFCALKLAASVVMFATKFGVIADIFFFLFRRWSWMCFFYLLIFFLHN